MKIESAINREQWLEKAVEVFKPRFEARGVTLPSVRVSTSWPSTKGLGSSRRRLGECWAAEAAADKKHQVFITPVIDDGVRVLDILIHELCHAALGVAEGHGPKFKKLATGLGLEGKMTATVASESLKKELETLVKETLGAYPHSKLNPTLSGRKRQGTRMIKCECPECGYTVRTTRKWLDDVGAPICPAHDEMKFELPDEEVSDE